MIKKIIFLISISISNISFAKNESEEQPSRYVKVVDFFQKNVNTGINLAETFVKLSQQEFLAKNYNKKTVKILEQSSNFLGTPYVWGGANENGVDCSGLILQIYKNSVNIKLPRTSVEMSKVGEKIKSDKDLLPGDLVFFNTRNFRFSHVGLYIGDNKFIHSPRNGAYVRLDNLEHAYWKKRFNGARRLLKDEEKKFSQVKSNTNLN